MLPRGSWTLQVSGNTLQQVEKFKCLGVVFTIDGRRNEEIDTRIGEANAVLLELCRSFSDTSGAFKHRKAVIFKSVFVPTLLYGHEQYLKYSGTDDIFAKSSQCDGLRQSAQL